MLALQKSTCCARAEVSQITYPMKKLMYAIAFLALLSSCGSKEKTGALTPNEESQLVDSMSQNLDAHTQELRQKTDSVSAEVDSLLKDL